MSPNLIACLITEDITINNGLILEFEMEQAKKIAERIILDKRYITNEFLWSELLDTTERYLRQKVGEVWNVEQFEDALKTAYMDLSKRRPPGESKAKPTPPPRVTREGPATRKQREEEYLERVGKRIGEPEPV